MTAPGDTAGRGFTLLEVMVAMAVLATAFAAALRLHAESMDIVMESRARTRALELARYKMTEVELAGMAGIGLTSGGFPEIAPDYAWELEIRPASVSPWSRVSVVVWNRGLDKSTVRVRLTRHMPSGPPGGAELR